jgi:hypothetical protein
LGLVGWRVLLLINIDLHARSFQPESNYDCSLVHRDLRHFLRLFPSACSGFIIAKVQRVFADNDPNSTDGEIPFPLLAVCFFVYTLCHYFPPAIFFQAMFLVWAVNHGSPGHSPHRFLIVALLAQSMGLSG